MRRFTCCALTLGLLSAAACDKQSDPSASTTADSHITAESPSSTPAPTAAPETTPADSPPVDSAGSLSERLLQADFRQPPGAETKPGLPPISLDPEVVDLGDIRPHGTATGALTLTNTGDTPLRILALRSSCACTVPEIENDTIEPGESIEIELELTAQAATGTTERYVTAMFEGYSQPVQLIAHADVNYGVRTIVTYEPDNQTRIARVELRSVTDDAFSIISADGAEPEYLDGFDPASDEPRTHYAIRQNLSSYIPDLLPKWFIVETDHPTSPIIDVPVRNLEVFPERQRHRFNIAGERLMFGRMTPGVTSEANFRVVGGGLVDAGEFVESIEWTNIDQCDVEVISAENNEGGIEMVIGVTPKDGVSGVLFGTLTIHAMNDARPIDIIGRVVPKK